MRRRPRDARKCVTEWGPSPSLAGQTMDRLMSELERTDPDDTLQRIKEVLKCVEHLCTYCQDAMERAHILHAEASALAALCNSIFQEKEPKPQKATRVKANRTIPMERNKMVQMEMSCSTLKNPNKFVPIALNLAYPTELLEFEFLPSNVFIYTVDSKQSVMPLCRRGQFWINSLTHEILLSENQDEEMDLVLDEHEESLVCFSPTNCDNLNIAADPSLETGESFKSIFMNFDDHEVTGTVENDVHDNDQWDESFEKPSRQIKRTQVESCSCIMPTALNPFQQTLSTTEEDNILNVRRQRPAKKVKTSNEVPENSSQPRKRKLSVPESGSFFEDSTSPLDIFNNHSVSFHQDEIISEPTIFDDKDSDDIVEEDPSFSFKCLEELDVRKHEVTILEMFESQTVGSFYEEESYSNNLSQKSTRTCDDGLLVLSFKSLVRGRTSKETSRLFAASLIMATKMNIEIRNIEAKDNPLASCPVVSDFDLVLMSNILSQEEINSRFSSTAFGSNVTPLESRKRKIELSSPLSPASSRSSGNGHPFFSTPAHCSSQL